MTYNASISDDVLIALRRIIRAIDLHSKYLVKHFGLTGPQLIILKEVVDRQEMSLSEIAAAVSLSHATLTGITDRLWKRKLITKERSAVDRRRVMIRPTEACRRLMERTPPPMQESFIDEFKKLQDWEQSMILSGLQRLVGMMDARNLKAEPVLTAGPIEVPPENNL